MATKLGCTLILDFDISKEDQRRTRKFVREEIINNLNANGRQGQTITWVEGWYLFDKDFPLPPEYGETGYWRITGYCYVPIVKS